MLDRFKLFQELEKVSDYIFDTSSEDIVALKNLWQKILEDETISLKINAKKWSLLVPSWQDFLGKTFKVFEQSHPYQIFAVDGSQIYYDKHQGPACSLINIGGVYLKYEIDRSKVELYSYPELLILGKDQELLGTEYINLYREQKELMEAVKKSSEYVMTKDPFLCLLDGSLIFFQIDQETKNDSENFLKEYIKQLQFFFEKQILHVAYMSFPRTKDLINIAHIVASDFDEKNIKKIDFVKKFLDTDLLSLFLEEGYRTIVFESKAPITYVYPKNLKPYFCYLNVGSEIIRLEFPEWIANNLELVDQVCSMIFDQAQKGCGYPVALFEAHEQAVVKSADRDFFYQTIKNMYAKNNKIYKISAKSAKKISPIM